MDWLNNPWIVGIGGGVLSGILVAVVSRWVLSRRDRKEYHQKVLAANMEVIYAIRSGIPEDHVPDRKIVDSLLSATARKYGVDRTDLLDPPQIGDELTKEIMDSSFISASTKRQYCAKLEALNPPEPIPDGEIGLTAIQLASKTNLEAYRARMVSTMSVTLGIVTGLMTIVLVFSDSLKEWAVSPTKWESLRFVLPLAIAFIATLLIVLSTLFQKRAIWRRSRDEDEGTRPKVSSHDQEGPKVA